MIQYSKYQAHSCVCVCVHERERERERERELYYVYIDTKSEKHKYLSNENFNITLSILFSYTFLITKWRKEQKIVDYRIIDGKSVGRAVGLDSPSRIVMQWRC